MRGGGHVGKLFPNLKLIPIILSVWAFRLGLSEDTQTGGQLSVLAEIGGPGSHREERGRGDPAPCQQPVTSPLLTNCFRHKSSNKPRTRDQDHCCPWSQAWLLGSPCHESRCSFPLFQLRLSDDNTSEPENLLRKPDMEGESRRLAMSQNDCINSAWLLGIFVSDRLLGYLTQLGPRLISAVILVLTSLAAVKKGSGPGLWKL